NGASTQHGGLQIAFSDGSNTNWTAKDQNNVNLNDFNGASASNRTVDLSGFAGKTISAIHLVQETTSGQGAYNLYFADIVIVSPDGMVRPIYNGQTSVSFTMTQGGGETGAVASANYCSACANLPDGTTTYFHGDQVGSNRLISAPNPTPSPAAKRFPIWKANYLPFGYEKNSEMGPNNYKFGTYARDAEGSALDYAHFRYYSSQFMRFMSPDPLSGDAANPQSLNRYCYAVNNPVNLIDPFGLDSGGNAPSVPYTCWDGVCIAQTPVGGTTIDVYGSPAQFDIWGGGDPSVGIPLIFKGGRDGAGGPTIPAASPKPKGTPKLDDDCAKQASSGTSGSIITGTNKSVQSFDAATMVRDASLMAGIDPAVVGATMALETNSNLAAPGHPNRNGTVDIGPMALNTAYAGQAGGFTAYPGALGTNLKAGLPFNGDPYANILSGATYLRAKGGHPERYVGNNPSRKGALKSLMPSMRNFFDCILKGLGLK